MTLHEQLYQHAQAMRATTLRDCFAADKERAQRLAFTFADWRVDVSRQLITATTLELLLQHADTLELPNWLSALFAGERLNITENRAALHTALRQSDDTPLYLGKRNIITDIRNTQSRMREISDTLRNGAWRGATNQPIKNVVQIGIGGSLLGTRLLCDALYKENDFNVRFVANYDADDLERALVGLEPSTTLFIMASKTFTTEEVLANGQAARQWLAAHLPNEKTALDRQFIAITANLQAARDFGIPEEHILPMWDWVGGRYSLWSAIGLALLIQSGWKAFQNLLDGAHAMDEHVLTTPLTENVPIQLALIDWWNNTFLEHNTRLVISYAYRLRYLAPHLQQLMLESNGKRVDWDGQKLDAHAPSIRALFGGIGTNDQHSYFQWLHQGMHKANIEFVIPVRVLDRPQRPGYLAHALAQPEALMCGRDHNFIVASDDGEEALRAARVCPGNVPSTMLLLPNLNAYNLGALLALYEHRTFIESILYRVNPFDQFGVELGKQLAKPLAAALASDADLPQETDAATIAQVAFIKKYLG